MWFRINNVVIKI